MRWDGHENFSDDRFFGQLHRILCLKCPRDWKIEILLYIFLSIVSLVQIIFERACISEPDQLLKCICMLRFFWLLKKRALAIIFWQGNCIFAVWIMMEIEHESFHLIFWWSIDLLFMLIQACIFKWIECEKSDGWYGT